MAAKFYCQFCGKLTPSGAPWDYESFKENTGACTIVCEDCCNSKMGGDCHKCVQRCAVMRGVILGRYPRYHGDMVVLPLDDTLEPREEEVIPEPPEDYYEDDYSLDDDW